ncbi:hypothetical protein ABC347_08715 [Sphingomonas sp. 1P06PA]|uniref:hypothetical protein n=1 Tax=Sphingomonas sp. 1P06PA TaxID=554121 RepID=UPI0039A67351
MALSARLVDRGIAVARLCQLHASRRRRALACSDWGTTASLWLPVSHDLPAVEHRRRASAIFGEPHGTALLVKNEDRVRMSLSNMLSGPGFDELEASSG